MTYHTLVNRDVRFVAGYWKWTIVITLFLVTCAAFTLAFTFHAFLLNFKTNCIANTRLAFKQLPPKMLEKLYEHDRTVDGAISVKSAIKQYNIDNNNNDQDYVIQLKEYITQIKELYNITQDDEKENAKKNSKFYKIWNLIHDDNEKRNINNDAKDMNFFETKTIHYQRTKWGSMITCNYFCFAPFMQGIIAIIWLAFFLICGYSKKNHSFLDEPWKIVVPSTSFFIAMTICSFIYIGFIHAKFNGFCYGFKSLLNNKDIPCGLIFNRFAIDYNTSYEPSTNYLLTIIFAWITAILWTTSVLIMVLRCIRASDFQVINLSISNVMNPKLYGDSEGGTTAGITVIDYTDVEKDKTIELNNEKKMKITNENNQYILIPKSNENDEIKSKHENLSSSLTRQQQQQRRLSFKETENDDDETNQHLFKETSLID